MRTILPTWLLAASVLALPAPALAWTWPVDGQVLRPFSLGDNVYAAGQHRGVEIAAATGAPVRAPAAGQITYAGTLPRYGKTLTIRTANGYAVTLLHLGTLGVKRDAVVAEGDTVATVGPTGDAAHSQPYVYLGIRRWGDEHGYVDPLLLLPAVAPAAVEETPVAPATGQPTAQVAESSVHAPSSPATAAPAQGPPFAGGSAGAEPLTPGVPRDPGAAAAPVDTGGDVVAASRAAAVAADQGVPSASTTPEQAVAANDVRGGRERRTQALRSRVPHGVQRPFTPSGARPARPDERAQALESPIGEPMTRPARRGSALKRPRVGMSPAHRPAMPVATVAERKRDHLEGATWVRHVGGFGVLIGLIAAAVAWGQRRSRTCNGVHDRPAPCPLGRRPSVAHACSAAGAASQIAPCGPRLRPAAATGRPRPRPRRVRTHAA